MFQHIRRECIENGVDFPTKTCRRRDQITGERGNESGRMGNCVAKSPSLSDQGGFGSFTRPSRPSLALAAGGAGSCWPRSLALRLRNLTPAESSVQLAARLGSKEGTRAFRQSLAFCFASNVPSLNKGREKMSKLLTDGHEMQADLKFDSTKMLRETNQDRKKGRRGGTSVAFSPRLAIRSVR